MPPFSKASDGVSFSNLPVPDEVSGTSALSCLVGESAATRRLRVQIERVGPHFRTALVVGEIGSGKELVGRALHERATHSRRVAGEFTVCFGAALNEVPLKEMLEACSRRTGFGAAQDTVYLDGVEALSPVAQRRLCGWMEERAAAGRTPRLVAATSENLHRMLEAGRFHADLYHRLATVEIVVEPLRRRTEDIVPLARHILRGIALQYGVKEIVSAEEALQQLLRYRWPGNVRQMENVLHNAFLRCDGDRLEASHLDLPPDGRGVGDGDDRVETLGEMIERHVRFVLERCAGNKVRAAEMLGISRSTLYRMFDESA
jgi:DNA-binding NtrC family response regulator